MKNMRSNREEGIALVVAVIFLVAMSSLVGLIISRVTQQSKHVDLYVDFNDAFQGVQAGFARAEAELNGRSGNAADETDGMVGVDPAFDLTIGLPQFGNSLVNPEALVMSPNVEYFAVSIDWTSDGVDNNGDGIVDDALERNVATIYSSARVVRGKGSNREQITVARTAEKNYDFENINIWNNALFADEGLSDLNGTAGNVGIHGSIHILGTNREGELVFEIRGTADVQNNWSGLPAAMRALVDPASQPSFVTVEGEANQESLNAKFRVKQGIIELLGGSEIGREQVAGNNVKERMDGIFSNGTFTDTDDLHSDNGFEEAYDLGDAIDFPTFDEEVEDPPLPYIDWYLIGVNNVFDGDMIIEANGDSFYWNASTGDLVEAIDPGPGNDAMPELNGVSGINQKRADDEFFIWFDATTNTLEINGRIPVDGDIVFEKAPGGGGGAVITYNGKGTMLAFDCTTCLGTAGGGGATGSENQLPNDERDAGNEKGDIKIDVDLLTGPAAFPSASLIGLMAEDDFIIAVGSQRNMMGGFYAQDHIAFNKQTNILGTIVGETFSTKNVPDIYQVPTLADGWIDSQRMIGSDPIRLLIPISFRELGLV